MGPTGKEWGCTTSGWCTRGTAPDVGGPTTPQVGIQRAAEPADNFRRPSRTESAIRTCAARHPYDTAHAGQTSLRGDGDEVNAELRDQLTERLALAGVEVLEVRLSHLAYAPEIAGVMLRRQQAEAIIDARQRIVEGAVGMVKQAIDQLEAAEVVHLDEARKAALVSNLLVVLCSESETTPVVNTGTT